MSLQEINELINHWVLGAAEAWWVLPVIFVLCVIDGVIPILPSESLVVALSSVWVGWGPWHLAALVSVAAAGAFLGDQMAYQVGRAVGTRGLKWLNRPKVQKVFAMADRQLEQRGAVLIFTARYIPVGRVAVNLTAGATGFSRRRFILFDALGCALWGLYSVAIGALAGKWMEHNKLLGIVISVAIALVLGWILDRVIHRFLLRFRPGASAEGQDRPALRGGDLSDLESVRERPLRRELEPVPDDGEEPEPERA